MKTCEKCGYRPMQTVPRQKDILYICSNPKCGHIQVKKYEATQKEG